MSKHPVSYRIGRICRLFATAGICLHLAACGTPSGASAGAASSSEPAASSGTSAASAAETSAEALPVITVVTDTVEDGDGPAEENTAEKNTTEGNSTEPSAPDGTFTITTPEAIRLIETFKPVAAIAMHYRNQYCHFNVTDSAEFIARTQAVTLPNEIELFKGTLEGCYVMEY